MKIVLVGPRGSGKSTIGRQLTTRWNIPLCDLDEWITERSQKSPNQWIEDGEEAQFRQWEAILLKEWLETTREGILATGGGAILHPESKTLLKEFSPVIWLKNSAETRKSILEKSPRAKLVPGSLEDEIAWHDQSRSPLYDDVSDETLNTDQSLEEVIAELDQLKERYE